MVNEEVDSVGHVSSEPGIPVGQSGLGGIYLLGGQIAPFATGGTSVLSYRVQ